MRKMNASNILISGMKGLGVEIAKNLILGGVKSCVLHDTEPVHISDLASQVKPCFPKHSFLINMGSNCGILV